LKLLSVENVSVRHGLLQAVREATFGIAEGEIVALIGANGAGKTTLLRAIAGAHHPSAGIVRLDGTDVTQVPAHRRVAMGIALVPEGRRLFTTMSVEENLRIAGSGSRNGEWSMERIFEAFPMLRARRKARAGDLSGGEQQATAIGRALMSNPRVLLLDEVSLGLSPLAVEQVYQSLQTLMTGKSTIVLVEQDLNRALRVATRVICMLEGRIVMDGEARSTTREQVTQAYFGLERRRTAVGTGTSA
jgi:branched-chain amino acid transport system ATP-binding protein